MTQQIHKQKDKFDEITDRTIEKLENLDKTKAQVIIDCALEFDKSGFEKCKICNELVKRLAKVADESYVRKILKDYPQYKDQNHVESAKSRRNIPAKPKSPTIEVSADKVKVEPINKSLPAPDVITTEGIENDGDDVLNRILDNAQDSNHNKPQGLNPDWYKPTLQRIEEQRQKIIKWNGYCERQRQKETPIERYCNNILGIKPDYEKTFEEHQREEEDN